MKWFVPGDFDGFFALFTSGLPDLLLIAGLGALCGFSLEFVTRQILPAVALSIFAGNIFYAWQAYRLSQITGRNDVTAIPFGVNSPTVFAYIFLVMLPVYLHTHDSTLAWHVGIFACFLSGIIQTVGAFCTDWLRQNTPRAALLCPLAGIGMAFLCLGYVLKVFQTPELALLPSIVILALYSSHLRLPLRLPAGLLCVMVGVLLVALLKAMYLYHLPPPPPITPPGFYPPLPVNLFPFLWHQDGWKFLSVIIPMSVLDTIVSLQVLESVKVAGDDYPTRPSLLVNGIATLIAAGFGSAFPTTLYFGHMAHKAIGARVGYSIINGVVTMVICLSGLIPLVLHFMPIEVVTMIVVWFGLVMIGQAFTEIPKAHAVAVAFGLLPMLASWAVELIDLAVRKAGSNLMLTAPLFGDELAIYGLIALSQGALLVSMLWAASLVYLSERRFLPAAGWLFAGSTLSFFGIIHAFSLTANGVENKIGFAAAPSFAFSYALAAAFLVGCHYYHRSFPALTPEPDAISGG